MSDTQSSHDAQTPQSAPPAQGWPNGPTRFEQRFGNATTRVATALVAIPIVVGAIWLGGWAFYAFVALISIGALMEFYWLAEKKGAHPNKVIGVAAALLLPVLMAMDLTTSLMYPELMRSGDLLVSRLLEIALLGALLMLLGAVTLLWETFRTRGSALLNVTATLGGIIYVPLLLSSLVGLRFHFHESPGRGIANVLMVLVTIWICDSAAYYCGRAFGRHKLFERVSPKKTWEGAIGGLVFSVVALLAARYWWLAWLTLPNAIVIGAIVGIFGQIGDLAESHLKRDAGVKDSSQLIPGHGGLLDRFDSLIIVAPLVYVYLVLFAG